MKELVYSTGSQVTPDKRKKDGEGSIFKAPKMKIAEIMALVTGAMSAFTILDSTDLGEIAQKVTGIVKQPWIAAGIVAVYVMMGVKSNAGTLE